MGKRWMKAAVGVPVAVVVLATAGTWGYINLVRDDAPERLTLESTDTTGATGSSTPTTAAAGAASPSGIDGTWKVATGSQAGYRVKEVLFGQSTEGVGRTDDVTGQFVIAGSRLTTGSFTVDMTTVASDENRRDNQFRGRIMDVSSFPTSTFEVTEPVALSSVPADGTPVDLRVTGELTLRGTTREVTVDLEAQRSGASIKVAGSIPIVFDEWGIPNPSFGPAETEDSGELEFLLVFGQ